VWQQATSQQVFKVITFSMDTRFQSFFTTNQSHHPPRCAEIQPMSEQAAAATRPYRGLLLDTHTLLHHAPDAVICRI